MQAGELRHRVQIQRKSLSNDDWGEPVDEWVTIWENVPAKIEALGSREFWAAQQINAEINCKIKMRWRDNVRPEDRIIHQTNNQAAMSPPEFTIYDIAAPVPDLTGMRELMFYCIHRFSEGFRSGST